MFFSLRVSLKRNRVFLKDLNRVQACFAIIAGTGVWASSYYKKKYRKIMIVHKLYKVVEQYEVWY